SLVSFWVRSQSGPHDENTSTWAVPSLGGQPRPYLDGVAEFDWSRDGSQLAFHTSRSWDPLYVSKDGQLSDAKLVFKAADGSILIFLRGRPTAPSYTSFTAQFRTSWIFGEFLPAGTSEQITSHNS
ncbi:MAG: hypothetical protein ABI197_13190, partial [Granulicella sp.]